MARTSFDHGHDHEVPCCSSCAHGGACESSCPAELGATDPIIPYDAAPFDAYNNREQLMSWNRYELRPFVYNASLTRGGATQLRYAQTCEGSAAMRGQPYTGSGGQWRKQLGALGDFDLPFGCPPGTSWNVSTLSCEPDGGGTGGGTGGPGGGEIEIPPGVPVVTEEQCAARELAAADQARRDARSELITTTAIAAVISGVIGWGLGKVLK